MGDGDRERSQRSEVGTDKTEQYTGDTGRQRQPTAFAPGPGGLNILSGIGNQSTLGAQVGWDSVQRTWKWSVFPEVRGWEGPGSSKALSSWI